MPSLIETIEGKNPKKKWEEEQDARREKAEQIFVKGKRDILAMINDETQNNLQVRKISVYREIERPVMPMLRRLFGTEVKLGSGQRPPTPDPGKRYSIHEQQALILPSTVSAAATGSERGVAPPEPIDIVSIIEPGIWTGLQPDRNADLPITVDERRVRSFQQLPLETMERIAESIELAARPQPLSDEKEYGAAPTSPGDNTQVWI